MVGEGRSSDCWSRKLASRWCRGWSRGQPLLNRSNRGCTPSCADVYRQRTDARVHRPCATHAPSRAAADRSAAAQCALLERQGADGGGARDGSLGAFGRVSRALAHGTRTRREHARCRLPPRGHDHRASTDLGARPAPHLVQPGRSSLRSDGVLEPTRVLPPGSLSASFGGDDAAQSDDDWRARGRSVPAVLLQCRRHDLQRARALHELMIRRHDGRWRFLVQHAVHRSHQLRD